MEWHIEVVGGGNDGMMGRMAEKFEEICEPQCSVKTILHNYVLYHICEKSNYANFLKYQEKYIPR